MIYLRNEIRQQILDRAQFGIRHPSLGIEIWRKLYVTLRQFRQGRDIRDQLKDDLGGKQ